MHLLGRRYKGSLTGALQMFDYRTYNASDM